MPKNSPRVGRVNDLLQRGIAKYIQDNYQGKSYGMITIFSVEVTKDLAYAKVKYSVLDLDKLDFVSEVLSNDAPQIRSFLAKNSALRTVPKLTFIYDDSLIYSNYMHNLIDSTKISDDGED